MNGKVQLNSRVDDSIKRELARASKITGLSMETIIRDAILTFAGIESKVIKSHAALLRLVIDQKALSE